MSFLGGNDLIIIMPPFAPHGCALHLLRSAEFGRVMPAMNLRHDVERASSRVVRSSAACGKDSSRATIGELATAIDRLWRTGTF